MNRFKSAGAYAVVLLFFFAAFTPEDLYAREKMKKSVLVLHSYHQGLGWTDSITRGLRATFEESPYETDICYEYMDTKRIYDQTHLDMLAGLFAHKYRNRRFDVIISSDDHAFRFLLKRREALFPGTPAVFCGVNYFRDEFIAQDPHITGVVESFSIKGTIDAALGVHPGLKTVYSVVDDTMTGNANKKLLSEIAPLYAGRLRFEYIENMSMAAVREKTATLPENSIVLLLHFTSDSLGNTFSLEESADLISQRANRPIYSFWDFHLNHGVVGGKLTTGAAHGRKAAELALRILGGEAPADIPAVKESPNQYIFDYNVMKRFNIPENLLPPGSLVINRPASFYEENKRLFWEAIGVFVFLCLIIMVFAVYLVKLRTARSLLKKNEEKFRGLVETTSDMIWEIDAQCRYTYVSPKIRDLLGYAPDAVMGKTCFDLMPEAEARRVSALFGPVMDARQALEGLENAARHKDGRTVILETSGVPIFDASGNFVGYRGIDRDISDRKLAEEHEKIIEHRFQEIMNRAPAVIYVKDLQGRYMFVNSHFENLSGLRRKDVIGKTDFDLFPWEVAESSIANDRRVIDGGAPLEAEEIGPVRGEMHTFISVKFPILDRSGQVNELCGISTDITDIRQTRAELARTQALLHNVVEQSPIPMVVATPDGVLRIINTACKKQLGVEDEPHIRPGMNLFDFDQSWTDYDDAGKVVPVDQLPLALALQGIAVRGKEIRIITKDGAERWEMVHGVPVFDGEGNILAGFVIFPDITDMKKAQHAIRKSERKYKTLVENSADIIVRFDRNHRYLYISPSFSAYMGADPKNLIGKSCADLGVDPALSAFWRERIRSVFDSGRPADTEYSIDSEDRTFIFNWRLFPEFDEDGNIDSVLSVSRDITRHKQAEKEKTRLEAQLLQSRKMEAVGTLAGGIAHDFNNILGIILGNAELAMDDTPEWNPARHNLEEVVTASLRAKDMIRQLLSFTRKSKHQRKPLKISAVIKESLKLLRSSIPSSVVINQTIDAVRDTVLADPTQVHQIMINLCANAAHAMQAAGGILTVGLETDVDLDDQTAAPYPDLSPGRYVKLTVSDTGCGIPSDVIGRIFDPYFTTKDVGEGTGMGLAVVHGIVKSHGGAISAYSESGKGTRFHILFPAAEAEAAEERKADEQIPGGGEAVLFVDDEASLADMGKQMLARLGYRTEACLNPLEALDMFRAAPDRFDLLITDMTMPGMTGDRLAESVLAIRPDLPVIMCTGYSNQISEARAKEIGIKAFIMKPLVRRDLAVTVRRALDADKEKG